jgi:acetyl-CoA synthetase
LSNTPIWQPTQAEIESSNLHALKLETGIDGYENLHAWSVANPEAFWGRTIRALGIELRTPARQILDLSGGISNAKWLAGAEMNIAESCFGDDHGRAAIVTRRRSGVLETITLGQLDRLSNRVANGIRALGLVPSDAIAIDMPMTAEAVAIYLGIVKSGCIVVSIPDSFASDEIARRLRIGDAKAVFTQDVIFHADKKYPLYEKVCGADAPKAIVLAPEGRPAAPLRPGDLLWEQFLSSDDRFETVRCSPQAPINYIFSSGTTGDPKCIPWDHTTPIKCGSDGMYHQEIRRGDVVCWPTNLGWMMGPWLIFAALLNKAAIALYEGVPGEPGFARFVQDAKVTMLGIVPSIVAAWRRTGSADGFDWSGLRCFSSSGEASNPETYGWLMSLNQNPGTVKPVVEYCGGTEIGGGYVSCTMDREIQPSVFNGQVMGIGFVVLDDAGQPCATGEGGEVFIATPSIGLSTRLHKGDNEKIYYQGLAGLRRHGDRLIPLGAMRYRSDGRADSAMNLNGIKIGSTEIETAAGGVSRHVRELAAVGIPAEGGGPDRLVIFVAMNEGAVFEVAELKRELQAAIAKRLNPQFRIHDVVVCSALPRTASHKVMYRTLRGMYARPPSR